MNNNNNNIGWLFFGGYKNILPSMLTILPSSSTRAILLTSLAIFSCIPLKAIQYYIIIICPFLDYYILSIFHNLGSPLRYHTLIFYLMSSRNMYLYNAYVYTYILFGTYRKSTNTIVVCLQSYYIIICILMYALLVTSIPI